MKTFHDIGVRVKRVNAQGQGKTDCPKCERKLSLSINVETGVWHCHGCLWAGRLNSLEQRVWKKPSPAPSRGAEELLSKQAILWLEDRGIKPEVAARHELFSARGVFKPYREEPDREVNYEAIAYPIYKAYGTSKELVNRAWRKFSFSEDLPDKLTHKVRFNFSPDCEQPLLNTHNVNWEKPIYWVEGWLDGLALESIGITNWLSFPNGSPKPPQSCDGRLNLLNEFFKDVDKCPQHVLALDNDVPGIYMRSQLAIRLGEEKCFIPSWPTSAEHKIKDAGDVLVHLGERALAEALTSLNPYPLSGTATQDEILLAATLNGGIVPDAKVGIPEIDEIFSLQLGQVLIWTGVPNMGKTTMCGDFVRRIIENTGWHAAMFLAEDTLQTFVVRTISQVQGAAFSELSEEERVAAAKWINDHYTYIKSEEVNDLQQILEIAVQLVRQKGLRILVIDPWNKTTSKGRTDGVGSVEWLQERLNLISSTAKKYNIAVIIIAHPPVVKTDKGTVREIRSFYEVNGGAQWANIADDMCVTNPPEGDNNPLMLGFRRARFEMLKVRRKPELGEVARPVQLAFDPRSKRFISMEDFYRLQKEYAFSKNGDINL